MLSNECYFYLLAIDEEDELVTPGLGPGHGIGMGYSPVYLPHVAGPLLPLHCVCLQ